MKCVASLSVFQISKVFRWFFCCRYSPAWQLPSGRRTFFQFDKRWNQTEADISNRGTGGRWISTWLGRIQINSTEREFAPLRCVAGCLLVVIGTDSELLFPLESISRGMRAYVLLLMPPPPDACFVRWFERSSELFPTAPDVKLSAQARKHVCHHNGNTSVWPKEAGQHTGNFWAQHSITITQRNTYRLSSHRATGLKRTVVRWLCGCVILKSVAKDWKCQYR